MQISLCIVVRNEASFLPAAIASARPVVDEIVVVDTGSTDGTQEIARGAGARVEECPWPGDLGAAHALPVEHARGDWVLALDADEVLDPRSRGLIRHVVGSGGADAYELPVRNYQYSWPLAKWRRADAADPLTSGAVGFVPTSPVRLFRRRPEYRYSGRVHQTVKPSVLAAGGRVATANVPIHHYGFLRFDRDKPALYSKLARRYAADEPGNARAWIDLGVALLAQGRVVAAASAFERAHAQGGRGDAAFHLGSTLLCLGRPGDAIDPLDEAILENAGDTSFFYDRADAWEARGVACEELGRPDDAELAYRTAIDLRPDSPAAIVGLASLLAARGATAEAGDLAERLLVGYRGSSAAWSTSGLVQLWRGDLAAASRALEAAVEIDTGNVVALMNLGLTYARARRVRRAARAYSAAREWLGSSQRRAELEQAIPQRYRQRPHRVPSYGEGLVVAVAQRLEGGAGRVLADGLLALHGRPRLVLCLETGELSGLRLRQELESEGVDVLSVPSETAAAAVLAQVRPSLVLHHWWSQTFLTGPLRVADERWVCIGHIALPMPLGYDAYVVLSPWHGRLQAHLPCDRVTVIPNGVDVARFEPTGTRRAGAPVTIAMLSRLEPAKFPRRLLDFLPPLDGARVLIAGAGGRRYELEPELAARGLGSRVRFVGSVPSRHVPRFLGGADIGLHVTELSEEVWGMSVHEMLAAGLPVVAEPKGNLTELVHDGRNGFLAAEPAQVAERLRLLVGSPELRGRMGAESRRIAQGFDLGRFRAAMRRLVEETESRPPLPDLLGMAAQRSHVPRRPARPEACYFVCATARSGSTLLCEALGNTGLAGEPAEFFDDELLRRLPGRFGVDDVRAYLAELVERTATPNGAFGAKVSYPALERLVAALRPDSLGSVLPGAHWVLVSRQDKVRQAVSWERALQTGVWSSHDEAIGSARPRPRFDADAIAARLAEIERLEACWERWFSESRVVPVRVTYEDLCADYEGIALSVLDRLGIDVGRVWFGPRRLARQADALTERWVERYHESRAARSSTTRAQTAAVS
jgi:LPS sulfotransferase NodH/glycosyltransferase involved in cell wall biosynthesis/Flp pilus assembly protein TadD